MTDLYSFLCNCTTDVRADSIASQFELLETLVDDWSASELDDFFEYQVQNMSYGEVPNALDEIATYALNDALKNRFIFTNGDNHQRYQVLKALIALQEYINSAEVLEYKDEEYTNELLLAKLLSLVSSNSIEYYLEIFVDVRPQAIDNIFDIHERRYQATQMNFNDTNKVNEKYEFVQYMESILEFGLGFDLVHYKDLPIGLPLETVWAARDKTDLQSDETWAEDIISMVVVSSVKKDKIEDACRILLERLANNNLDLQTYTFNKIRNYLVKVK